MKVSREQAALNRERIVDTAARLFRENGYDGIGVADLMKAAGLTHGGFYGHFTSKEDLLAEACAKAMDGSVARWQQLAQQAPASLASLARHYLTPAHRDHPGPGCAVAALGPDVSRVGPAVRHAMTQGVRAQIDVLAGTADGTPAQQRQQAMAAYAAMVGGLVLARAVDDPALSEQIMAAVVAGLEQA
jgi:TetR/AcrR family transcriptional repressor of nem operon